MDEFVMTIKKHKETIVIALAILMFILFGFCPAIDIIGKAKIGGLKLLFEGSGLGFARFLSIFVLCLRKQVLRLFGRCSLNIMRVSTSLR